MLRARAVRRHGPAAPPAGYRLAWQDDFDGTTLDTAKWQYRTDTRYWSTQLPANVSVSNGLLNLHLKKETVGTVNYTAGGVISRNLVRYGYYEALMKVPPGGGWHTSFWMMKYNRPATDTVAIELDVLENDSVTPLKYAVNVHRHLPAPHVTFGTKTFNSPSLSSGFHLLGCEFIPTTIKYFFNGALVQTVDATNYPAWNAGSRDQLLVGRNTAPFRSVFSFDLAPLSPGAVIHQAALDLKTVGGSGTVGALQSAVYPPPRSKAPAPPTAPPAWLPRSRHPCGLAGPILARHERPYHHRPHHGPRTTTARAICSNGR